MHSELVEKYSTARSKYCLAINSETRPLTLGHGGKEFPSLGADSHLFLKQLIGGARPDNTTKLQIQLIIYHFEFFLYSAIPFFLVSHFL